jgi:hypothetical protein
VRSALASLRAHLPRPGRPSRAASFRLPPRGALFLGPRVLREREPEPSCAHVRRPHGQRDLQGGVDVDHARGLQTAGKLRRRASGDATVVGARADELGAFLGFAVGDEDAGSSEAIGDCLVTLTGPEFLGTTQVLSCGVDAPTMNSGFELRWRLERF